MPELGRASPRSRGWTRLASGGGDSVKGFPALAGMDPWWCSAARSTPGLPRARGDGPSDRRCASVPPAASPRSRGWTRMDHRVRVLVRGFPALAGMDPRSAGAPASRRRLPRARGDGPAFARLVTIPIRASPRSRGWTQRVHLRRGIHRGFPALAGMDRARRSGRYAAAWLPRARGDGPVPVDARRGRLRASPRSRGWTVTTGVMAGRDHGFPALAGMNPCSSRAPTGLSLERVYALSSVSRPSIRSEIGSRRSCRATGA